MMYTIALLAASAAALQQPNQPLRPHSHIHSQSHLIRKEDKLAKTPAGVSMHQMDGTTSYTAPRVYTKEDALKLSAVFKPGAKDEEIAALAKTLKTEKRWSTLCNDDKANTSFSQYADKDAVKNLVRGMALGNVKDLQIPTTLLTVEDANQINANLLVALPDRFVMKATHGSGMTVIVRGKDMDCRLPKFCAKTKLANASLQSQVQFLQENCRHWLGLDYGKFAEKAKFYSAINPKCIFEEYIEQGRSSTDFKVWTFHGTPLFVQVVGDSNAFFGNHTVTAYTADTWEPLNMKNYDWKDVLPAKKEKPKQLAELLKAASVLSRATGFAFVRADFYISGDKVYFSELTKTPMGCHPFKPAIATKYLQHIWGDPSARRIGSDLLKLVGSDMPKEYYQTTK